MKRAGMRGPLEQELGLDWEALFWDVFERSLNPIVVLDESRRLVAVNPAAAETLRYRPEELVGRSVDEMITSPPQELRVREWRRLLQAGEQTGAHTYTRSDGSQVEVDFAMRRVRVGKRTLFVAVVLPPSAAELARQVSEKVAPLTVREREVVALIALGLTTSRIAEQLFISAETVRTHVRNVMAKLGVHTRVELVAVAFSRGDLLEAAGP
jgi:PAS domain S-box-containing protein